MTKELTGKIIYVLTTLRTDAQWALEDKWDRSDEGFEHQIKLINELLKRIEKASAIAAN